MPGKLKASDDLRKVRMSQGPKTLATPTFSMCSPPGAQPTLVCAPLGTESTALHLQGVQPPSPRLFKVHAPSETKLVSPTCPLALALGMQRWQLFSAPGGFSRINLWFSQLPHHGSY